MKCKNHSTNPKNFYGKTKLKIEKFLLQHKKSFDNLIILRLFNIIGLTKNFKVKEFLISGVKDYIQIISKYQKNLFK